MSISQFLRNSGSALLEVDDHDLLLERRDGADIYLKRADREHAFHESVTASGRMMAALLADETTRTAVLNRMEVVLPWTTFLPDREQERFAEEFVRVVAACAEIDNFTSAGMTLKQWKNTAGVYADTRVRRSLSGPIEPGPIADRPELAE